MKYLVKVRNIGIITSTLTFIFSCDGHTAKFDRKMIIFIVVNEGMVKAIVRLFIIVIIEDVHT